MAISHRYTDFGVASDIKVEQATEITEDTNLEAFENGFQAGWDDAMKARADEAEQVTAELCQRLEDMSFTYHEVYAKMTRALKPLMVRFVTKLLPDIAQKSLHAHILQEVSALIDSEAQQAIEVAVSPAHKDAIDEALQDKLSLPFQIVSEAQLTAGQAYIRVGQAEREIDLDAVLQGLGTAVEAYFNEVIPEKSDE